MCQLCSSSMPAGMLLACMPVSFTSALSPSMAMVSVMYDTVPMAASVSPTGSTAMMFCNRAKYGHSRCRLAAGQQQRVCCQAADSSLYCERRLRPFWEAIELARLSGEFVCSADTFCLARSAQLIVSLAASYFLGPPPQIMSAAVNLPQHCVSDRRSEAYFGRLSMVFVRSFGGTAGAVALCMMCTGWRAIFAAAQRYAG